MTITITYPTAQDQYMLELINRDRLDPQAAANLYLSGNLNEGLFPGTISTDAKQPLAFNLNLNNSAEGHSQWMLDNDIFSHTGAGGTTSQQRMVNAGYIFTSPSGSGENIAFSGTTGTPDFTTFVRSNYENLFIDSGFSGRGHRLSFMNNSYQEIGISSLQGQFTSNGTTYNGVMTTQDFAYSSANGPFITGVAYTDAITNDNFYTVGEGIGGITVTAVDIANSANTFTTTTWFAGGYSLEVNPNTTYNVTFSGDLDQDGMADDTVTYQIIVGSENVKQDVVTDGLSVPMTYTVTNNADSGSGSLRQAIINANANVGSDTIVFASGLSGATINLTSGELIINDNLTITGLGENQLTINGGGNSRIFRLKSTSVNPKSLTVQNLTLTNGFATPTDVMPEAMGGAIATEHQGILTVQGVTFDSNIANDGGGAIYSAFEGQLTVIDSQFLNNRATGNNNELGGGAIAFRGTGNFLVQDSNFIGNKGINGGAIYNLQGNVTVENSTFINNDVLSATVAPGTLNPTLRGYGGAFYSDRASSPSSSANGTIKFVDSIFENNQGKAAGGAIYVFTGSKDKVEIQGSAFRNNQTIGLTGGESGDGGAIELQSDAINQGLIIANSEFSGNRAVDRGGAVRTRNAPTQIFNSTFSNNATTLAPTPDFQGGLGGALEMSGSVNVKITNVTFADNHATWVGGAISKGNEVNIELNNSILYNNTASNGTNNWGILQHVIPGIVGSNNIQFPNNGSAPNSEATPGIITADPLLGLLSDNGGITRTRKLLTGSPAINAGNNSLISLDLLDIDNDGNTTEPTPSDQRGNSFQRIVNGTVDIGAYEHENLNQAPVITSTNFSIPENLTQVGTIQANDADGDILTYGITGGLDSSLFQINLNTGLLSFKTAPDYENPLDTNTDNIYQVQITANDGSLNSQPALINVSLTNVNEGTIQGTAGADNLTGTTGNDVITGLGGRDIITGGLGNDTFVYTSFQDAGDTITDFQIGSDRIDISLILDNIGYLGSNPITDSYLRFNEKDSNTILRIDPDGTGSATAVSLVRVMGVTSAQLANLSNFII